MLLSIEFFYTAHVYQFRTFAYLLRSFEIVTEYLKNLKTQMFGILNWCKYVAFILKDWQL